mgnify:CR=1 FL=1
MKTIATILTFFIINFGIAQKETDYVNNKVEIRLIEKQKNPKEFEFLCVALLALSVGSYAQYTWETTGTDDTSWVRPWQPFTAISIGLGLAAFSKPKTRVID